MVSVYELKPRFQAWLRPMVATLAKKGVTANQVTIAAVVLSVLVGLFLAVFGKTPATLLILPAALFVRMALNAIDGMLAREFAMKSDLGAVLNELGDVISDAALYLPLALTGIFSPYLLIPVVFLAVVSEMTGVMSYMFSRERRYDGPMGKSDRAVVFGTLGFFLGVGVSAGVWVNLVVLVVGLLSLWTIYNRSYHILAQKV